MNEKLFRKIALMIINLSESRTVTLDPQEKLTEFVSNAAHALVMHVNNVDFTYDDAIAHLLEVGVVTVCNQMWFPDQVTQLPIPKK